MLTDKPCSKCGEIKLLDMFSPAKNGPLGRNSWCKKCNAEYAAERKRRKKIEAERIESMKLTYPRVPDHMKQCKYCLEVKVKEGNFRKQKECAGGVVAKCHECFNRDRPSRDGSEASKKSWRKYYANNKEILLEKARNSEKRKEYNAKRYVENRDSILLKSRLHSASPRGKALNAKRQSHRNRKLQKAQPKWLSKEQITQMEDIYWLAQDLKLVSDQVYHVDHIVPLQGRNICGLHVPWNLQILPADVNLRKSNKMET